MSTWGNDSRLKLTEEAVTAFEQANGITVQVENSEFGSYWDKLATQTAANDAPDVIQMDESYIAAYGGRDALLDLSTQSSVLDLSAMDAKVLDTGKVGDTWSVRLSASRSSVGVNPELLLAGGCRTTRPGPGTTSPPWRPSPRSSAKGVVGMDFFGLSAAEIGVWARQRNQRCSPRGPRSLGAWCLLRVRQADAGHQGDPSAGGQVEATTAALDLSPFTNKAAFHLQFHTQIAAFVAASGAICNC